MTVKSQFLIVPVLLFCRPVFVWAQTDPNNWEKLNLNSTTIAGAKVYYEKSFEPNLPFFEKKYKEFLSDKDKSNTFDSKKNQILADINSILGISEPDTELQDRAWTEFIDAFSSLEMITIYLVKQSTTKDFIRAGGTLPNFTYDKASDTVKYNPQITRSSKDGPLRNFEFAFPISSDEAFEEDISLIFRVIQDGFKSSFDIAIHEIVEMSLLKKAKPTDPYWRWFTDGVANAVTYEILTKHAETEYADGFIKDHDVNNYGELRKELNLRYWLTGRFCILLHDMPTESGKRFNYARYVFSMHEIRRLIEEHGIDCIRRIMDEISAKQSRTGSDLLKTIKNVTGEDMNVRLAAYQSFEQREQGIAKYVTAFNEASKNKDYKQMVFNLFRMHELRLPSEAEQLLGDYRYASSLLFKLGFEKDADTTMQNCMQFFSNPGFTNGRLAASEIFMIYALECSCTA